MAKQMFHRHIPTYTAPEVSPNNAETRRNIGGDMTRQARLPPFALYH